MQVNGVTNSQGSGSSAAAAVGPSVSLDSDQFMQILMAELTHQNPLEPMSDSEMMSQFAQLNSLQELRGIHTSIQSLTSSNQVMYLSSLIGRTVTAYDADGAKVQGVVQGVVTDNETPMLRIGDAEVALADVVEVEGEVQ